MKLLAKLEVIEKGVTSNGETPLSMASRRGDRRVVQALVDVGLDVNFSGLGGITPLMHAAVSEPESAELVKILIAAGADKCIVDDRGLTALNYAMLSGNLTIKRIIMEESNCNS